MKFSPKFRTKELGIKCSILGSFCSFLNLEGADFWPQTRRRKIPYKRVDKLLVGANMGTCSFELAFLENLLSLASAKFDPWA